MDACVCDSPSVYVPHSTPGPSSIWGAEAGSRLGVTGRPVAVAAELAGGAVAARVAGPKAVWGLQAGRAGTHPSLGVTGAAVSAAAGLVTLWPPHPWGTRCERREEGGHQSLLTPVSQPPHMPRPLWPKPHRHREKAVGYHRARVDDSPGVPLPSPPLTAGAVVTSPGLHTLALIGGHAAAMDTLLGTQRWGRDGGERSRHPCPDPPPCSEGQLPPTPGTWRSASSGCPFL